MLEADCTWISCFPLNYEWCASALHEVNADSGCEGPIGPGVRDVAPVVRQPSPDIVIHAPSGAEDSIGPPSNLVFKVVRVCLFGLHLVDVSG